MTSSMPKIHPHHKRRIALALFVIFFSFVTYDLVHELAEASHSAHGALEAEIIEVSIMLLGCAAFAALWFSSKNEERNQVRFEGEIQKIRDERDEWRNQSTKLINDFQAYITHHFDCWHLTQSEKEVGLLLLKGLSFKEIAEIRQVQERTIRNQSLAIYSKSGLSGKHELAAYFLEELLYPQKPTPPVTEHHH